MVDLDEMQPPPIFAQMNKALLAPHLFLDWLEMLQHYVPMALNLKPLQWRLCIITVLLALIDK